MTVRNFPNSGFNSGLLTRSPSLSPLSFLVLSLKKSSRQDQLRRHAFHDVDHHCSLFFSGSVNFRGIVHEKDLP
jgi:hypothetical protein